MDERKNWLEKVLDDASADVATWPKWMRNDGNAEAPTRTTDCAPQEGEERLGAGKKYFD